jgi:hypothetical protein
LTLPEALAYDALHIRTGKVSGVIIMGATTTVNVSTASAGLLPLLHAAPWQGHIAAVFQRSLLLSAPDGRLVHLHTGPQLVSPFSLRLESTWTMALRAIPLSQGVSVYLMGTVIDIAGQLRLRLDSVAYYHSPRPFTGAIEARAIKIAQETLTSCGRSGGFDRLPSSQTLVTAMQQAVAAGDIEQMCAGAHSLIGLGPGLTPSGDDFLVGCLRGLWLMSHDEATTRDMFARLGDRLLSDLKARTTQVGAEFIRYALAGSFAEILDHVAEALVAPAHPPLVTAAIGRLLAQGGTSGSDTMRGLLTCIDALSANPARYRSPGLEGTAAVAATSATTNGSA